MVDGGAATEVVLTAGTDVAMVDEAFEDAEGRAADDAGGADEGPDEGRPADDADGADAGPDETREVDVTTLGALLRVADARPEDGPLEGADEGAAEGRPADDAEGAEG